MPVETPHKAYAKASPKWTRCRDCYEGSDSVKAKKTDYLPPLDSHESNPRAYEWYLLRALFYNAVGRTVDGLAGGIFQKPMETEAPPSAEAFLKDVTLTGQSAEMFALELVREELITGRYGILIDVSGEAAPAGKDRPYWAGYRAEDIISWRTSRQGGDEVLTRVVLSEELELEKPEDPFVIECETVYRVLELVDGIYTQTTYRKNKKSGKYAEAPLPGSGNEAIHQPTRRGTPLDFIPFIFLSPMALTPDVAKPPLEDLVDVNISHYQSSADLEHGRHWTALPTPWVAGIKQDGALSIGSGKAWVLDKDGKAGMLEFTGQGLKALETADTQKRGMMATLGARLLETQPAAQETLGAVTMRHSGEHANLRTIAATAEQGLTMALQIAAWWAAGPAAAEASDWADVEAAAKLNKEFFAVRMTDAELKAWVMALQAGKVAYPTFYMALERGGLARAGVTAETELQDIERFGAELEPDPGAGGDILPDDGDVTTEED
jgi:hypothetical protein